MSIDSDFGKLIAGGQADPDKTRDAQIAVLLTHARQTTRSLEDMGRAVTDIQTTMHEMGGLMKAQREELADNTEITTTVRDAVAAGRVAGGVIKWVGYISAACTAIYAAWWTLTHIGQPPAGG